MTSCLGMYIEDNLIKYAKVTKEHENVKVDSFGVKFFDKIEEAISQIVEETYSFGIPIFINSTREEYVFFNMFSLLNRTDLKRAINLEFDTYCAEKGYNANTVVTRYALTDSLEDKEKLKTIFTYMNKAELGRLNQLFEGQRLEGIVPLPMVLPNIIDVQKNENILILNLEKETTLTIIIGGKIYSVKRLENGIGKVLNEMNISENSYSKAYEILKNITMYTSESMDLQSSNSNYLEDVSLSLSKIIQEIKTILEGYKENFENIYIGGTGTVINNIDLFFQEQFLNSKCEILRPYFINGNIKTNLKDYIEVDSAIALAMQGLGYGIKEINFKREDLVKKFKVFINSDVLNLFSGQKKKQPNSRNGRGQSKLSGISEKLKFDKFLENKRFAFWLQRVAIQLIAFIIVYSVVSITVEQQIIKKQNQTQKVKASVQEKVAKLNQNIKDIKDKKDEYISNKKELERLESKYTDKMSKKNAITTLLNEIMYVIPQEVVITSIDVKEEQTSGDNTVYKAVIGAQSSKYEYLGYLKAKIKEDNILKKDTVISSSGEQQGGIIKVTIEGELP